MNAPVPLSPIHAALLARNPVWSDAGSQPLVVRAFDGHDAQRAAVLGIADLSQQPRAGVKGRGAANWLAGLGLSAPARPNAWHALEADSLIARLGLTEYLVEGEACSRLLQTPRSAGVYSVLRQDAAFALCGPRVNDLLLQTCNVDFRALNAEPDKVILSTMAGVAITLLAAPSGSFPHYQLWCDGTYGVYLWETLSGIAEELGGGCIGLDALQTCLTHPVSARV